MMSMTKTNADFLCTEEGIMSRILAPDRLRERYQVLPEMTFVLSMWKQGTQRCLRHCMLNGVESTRCEQLAQALAAITALVSACEETLC